MDWVEFGLGWKVSEREFVLVVIGDGACLGEIEGLG